LDTTTTQKKKKQQQRHSEQKKKGKKGKGKENKVMGPRVEGLSYKVRDGVFPRRVEGGMLIAGWCCCRGLRRVRWFWDAWRGLILRISHSRCRIT